MYPNKNAQGNNYNPNYNNQANMMPPPPPPTFVMPNRFGNKNDVEQGPIPDGTQNWGDFSTITDKVVRIKFIRKVYAIISLQLLITFGIVSIFVFVQPVKDFASKTTAGVALYFASYVIFVVLIISMTCCQKAVGMRKFPINYILLSLVTLTMSYMLGMISSYHRVESVLIAVGVTLVVVIGVTIVSMQTKYDFTNCWMLMICLSFAFLGFGIAVAITSSFSNNYIMQAVYGGLGAVLMSMFLAIDTQMLMGGKNRKYKFHPEDYIYAALQIYIDICYIFIYILSAVGGGNK